ncbi:MAG: FAD-binding protein [Aestuariivita sp.]|nr:FAD-binding protein [Aestuariivita sp.]
MFEPHDESELTELVSAAQTPLAVRGGNTRGIVHNAEGVTTKNLSGISLYEPGALTVVVKAGTTVTELNNALAEENQRLAFEPMDYRSLLKTTGEPTVGGVVAANVSGPRRIAVGGCRDFLLGVRFVNGLGKVIKNGGRVMKNVTGYDLVKLMAGSYGTLGILTELSLKVLPRPETEVTIILHDLDDRTAVGAMSKALGSPYEVTGAACLPIKKQTVLRLEGFEDSLKYRTKKLTELLGGFGDLDVISSSHNSAKVWHEIRDVIPFHGLDGDVWRFSVKPSDGPEIVEKLNIKDVIYDWGGGLVWIRSPKNIDIRAKAGAFCGHATLVRAEPETYKHVRMFQPENSPIAALSTGLRAKFDPRGILNQGLMSAD